MTDKSVVPIEAVHDDGRVIALGELQEHGNHMWPEKAKSADGLIEFYISRSRNEICAGTMGDGWRIRNVASNPLSLETSDLDPITPEEDAVATAILAAVGRTRQSHDTVVRAIRAGLVKAGAVIVPGWQAIETAPRDGTHVLLAGRHPNHGWVLKVGTSFAGCWWSNGNTVSPDMSFWMPLPSAHSIQSGGEGGEG